MPDSTRDKGERSQLAGSNRLELLVFALKADVDESEAPELYGVNVFKIREMMEVPPLIKVPGTAEYMIGVASIRGAVVPVIDLKAYCGVESECKPEILVVTEFNRSTQGFLVYQVDNIVESDWKDIQPPPDGISAGNANLLTAITQLEDGRMLMILDVEKVIADVLGSAIAEIEENEPSPELAQRMIFFADDSGVARLQVSKILDSMGIPHRCARNGQEALSDLQHLAEAAANDDVHLSTRLQAIVTDIEMPIMDGYVLTQNIKSDRRFDGIPVMMHSSLSSSENIDMGLKVGADGYIPKLRPREFAAELSKLIHGASDEAA